MIRAQRQTKWSTKNNKNPKTDQICCQKMMGTLGQTTRQKIIRVLRQVKLVDKK